MPESPPLVSVVVIFLDAERFLAEAIESVRAQTYPHWELLLVDDGSADASSDMARRFAAADPARVRYLEHPGHANRGMSASRNRGLGEARGEFVAFLDADDVWLPEKLERQVPLLRAHPEAALVYGATLHWYGWTGRPEDAARDVPRRLGVPPNTLVAPPALPVLYLRGEAQTPGICGMLVRRAALERAGGFEERFRGMFEDQVAVYKLTLGAPAYVEGGSWDLYRQHPDSFSRRSARRGEYSRRGGRASPAHAAFLDWLEGYVAERAPRTPTLRDPALLAALWEQRWPYRHPLRARAAALWERARGLPREAAARAAAWRAGRRGRAASGHALGGR